MGHHLSTIEGGMVATADEELHRALVISRSHGWDRHLPPAEQKELRAANNVDDFYAKYTFYDLAYNIRPTEINGFLGNDQLQYWDEIVGKRFKNFVFLNEAIKSNPDLISVVFIHMDVVSNFAVPVILRDEKLLGHYMKKFSEAEVEIRPMIAGNMARQPFFRKYVSNPGNQPNAEFIHTHSFYFGNNPELTDQELNVLKKLLEK